MCSHYIAMSAGRMNTFLQVVSYTLPAITLEIAAFASLIVLLSTSFILSLGAASSKREKGHLLLNIHCTYQLQKENVTLRGQSY